MKRYGIKTFLSGWPVLVFCLSPISISGSLAKSLFPNPVFEVGATPISVAVGDFNRDGIQDLAVANSAFRHQIPGDVSILLGIGDATFGPQIRIGTGDRPVSLTTGDFNADGIQDLAVVNSSDSSMGILGDLSILLGHGDGTFGPETRIGTGDSPISVAVGDFNTDGIQDLAVVNLASGDVSVIPGLGDGTFGSETRFEAGGLANHIAIGDFNTDGNQDLVIVNRPPGEDISLLLGRGDGTFGPLINLGEGDSPNYTAVGDFNGDGNQDLAVANRGVFPFTEPGYVSVYLGDSDGTFGSKTQFGAGLSPSSVSIGDFNADGIKDLAVANNFSDDISLLLGLGDGTFGTEYRFSVGSRPIRVATGDFNADGNQDLAVTNSISGTVSVLVGLGDGTFNTGLRFGAGEASNSVAIGDFNADRIQDLAIANFGTGIVGTLSDVSVLLGLGDGTFGPESRFGAGGGPLSVANGDFNGDGTQDLAVANQITDDVSVLLGLGDGSFSSETRFGAGGVPLSAAIGDFNRDGDQDLAVANLGSKDVSILLGFGDGTFGPESRFEAGGAPRSVAIGDFNGDGIQDLAVANQITDDVSVLLGLGNGSFSSEAHFGVGDNPTFVAVGDLNADGIQDLAVANSALFLRPPGRGDVSFLLGIGDGTFGPQLRLVAGVAPHSIAIGDFDNDGKRDLAVGNFSSNDVSLLLGLGNGFFRRGIRFSAGNGSFSIAAGDFNADGRQDLAVANLLSDDISILLNQGPFSSVPVSIDINPRRCPNKLKVKRGGRLSLALLGTSDFDVTTIDQISLRLLDVAPIRFAFKDVATPFIPFVGKESEFDCTDEGADGFLDLTLRFENGEVIEAIEDSIGRKVQDDEIFVLTVTGKLKEESGGTPIRGEDVVVIKKDMDDEDDNEEDRDEEDEEKGDD